MTFDQLETLEMIVEKGSFKSAAEHLYKTQPSLSVAIKKLEEEFDLKLFNRDDYRPKLTAEGLVFYNWAKQTLSSFRELRTIGQELGVKKIEPFLTVVLDPLACFEAISSMFKETILSKYPTEMTFRSEIMERGIELLISAEADFAISTKGKDSDQLESAPFDKIEMVPVIAKSLAKAIPSLQYKYLKQYPQVIVSQAGSKAGLMKRETAGIMSDSKKCFVTDHNLKNQMIMNGLGWGRLPRSEIQTALKKEQLVEIKDQDVKPFILDLHVMRCKNKPMGPVAKIVWAELVKNASAKKKKI